MKALYQPTLRDELAKKEMEKHVNADINRLYFKRSVGGRGFMNVEDSVDIVISCIRWVQLMCQDFNSQELELIFSTIRCVQQMCKDFNSQDLELILRITAKSSKQFDQNELFFPTSSTYMCPADVTRLQQPLDFE
ncbi:unnamed protein product, partial [Porites evermanni]